MVIDFLKWRNKELMKVLAWPKVCFFFLPVISVDLIKTLPSSYKHTRFLCFPSTVYHSIGTYNILFHSASFLFLYRMQDTEILFLDNSLGMAWSVPYGWTSCSTALTARCKHNSLITIWLWHRYAVWVCSRILTTLYIVIFTQQ